MAKHLDYQYIKSAVTKRKISIGCFCKNVVCPLFLCPLFLLFLKKMYLFDFVQAHIEVKITADLIVRVHRHINGKSDGHPVWLDEIMKFLDETVVEDK